MNSSNENYTPRERVDDALLARLLRENEPPVAVPAQARVQNCSCTRRMEKTDNAARTACPPAVRPGRSPAFGRSLAMVYSPVQEFEDLYDAEQGLHRGTIFRQLDLPLKVGRCQEGRWDV